MLYVVYIDIYSQSKEGASTGHNNSINITMPAAKLLSIRNLYF